MADMLEPRTESFTLRTLARAVLLLVALSALSTARAQQFTDATATWFPAPDPLEYTNQLTVGDLDQDGDLDLIFANGGNFSSAGPNQKVRVYINHQAQSRFLDESDARTGGHAGLYRGVELGDCEHDGDLDVLLASDFNRLPALLINNGAGVFTSEGATRLPNLTLSSSRGQFGDVDNDGDLDIFITNGGSTNRFGCGQYRLYLNDGTCHYTDATNTNVPLGNVCNNMDAIFGDADGDLDLDIRTASTGANNSRMYVNNGSGVFTLTTLPADEGCYSYDFGDMDGDGDLDLLGANGAAAGTAELLLRNDGNMVFTDVSSQISPNPSQDDNDSKFFDYDNDGDLDLIIARISGGEKLYQNTGGGNFTLTSGVFQQIADSSLDVKLADVDGNGTYDVITAQGESGNYTDRIYLNSGPADTLPPRVIKMEQVPDAFPGSGPWIVRVAVLDDMTSDRNFFDKGVVLNYSVGASPTLSTPMRHSGGQIYRGAIPDQPTGGVVSYWVSATDFNDNTVTGVTRQFTVLGSDLASGSTTTPLLVGQAGANIALSWGASCAAADDDYAIYGGTLGNWHPVKLVCSTSGSRSLNILPGLGNRYYLIVPRNDLVEGSYGLDSNGDERPAAASACVPQFLATCP